MQTLANRWFSPPVVLAPMAGITDLPFRSLVSRFGAGMVVSEMVASRDMVQSRPGTREKAELGLEVENTVVQLAGCEPQWIAEAARMVADRGAKIIDINMGCPAKKVTSASGLGASGSALMREPDHALRLIEAVVGSVDVPVTLKTRLGWDHDCLNAAAIARRAEAAGVAMITIHGRTRCQFYKGRADWAAIREVTEAVHIPVLANGDIVDAESACEAQAQSGAAGVMIGRGAQGRPWLLAQIAAELYGTDAPEVPRGAALTDLVAGHFEAMLDFYGIDLGGRAARKHLGWYMDHVGTPAALRREVLTAAPAQVPALLPRSMDDAEKGDAPRQAA